MWVDSHCHFGGSIPVSCIWEIIDSFELYHLASSYDEVLKRMTFTQSEPFGFHKFLNKFTILDDIPWSEQLISYSIRSICNQLKHNNVSYTWLDFSTNKYERFLRMSRLDIIKLIYGLFEEYASGKVGLVLSVKYEDQDEAHKEYAKLCDNNQVLDYLVGIDLVGDESKFNKKTHVPIIESWSKSGKMVRAHVGEYGPKSNIKDAIVAGVTNIAHGLNCDKQIADLAISKDIYFDLGITSNFLTGIYDEHSHPIKNMAQFGLKLTFGTDDPIVCSTSMPKEMETVLRLGLTQSEVAIMQHNALLQAQRFSKSKILLETK